MKIISKFFVLVILLFLSACETETEEFKRKIGEEQVEYISDDDELD